jgi:hypothetical protein
MKKQISLMALGLFTLVGGSWLAAQQRDAVRTTRTDRSDEVSAPAAASDSRRAEAPTKARRPTAAAAARPAQEARRAVDQFHPEVARFPEAGSPAEVRAFDEWQIAGPQVVFGMQPRMTPEDAARMRAFQDAIKELRGAEDEAEKATARERVAKLVSEQLDADLDSREKELTAIEQRAKELRKQLEERKTAKPELLKMLVMLIDNPQVGLGIPPEWMQMLMRGQPDRHRFSPVLDPNAPLMLPAAPPRPNVPSVDSASHEDIPDEDFPNAIAELEPLDEAPIRGNFPRP